MKMNRSTTGNRRSFLQKTAAAGMVAAVIEQPLAADNKKAAPNRRELRIGCLNVGTYSHLTGLWGPVVNPRRGEKDTPFTGMRITHCWDIEPEKAAEFSSLYGCEVVKDFDGMLGKVDGIISGGYYNHPWNHIIHEPYLEAGLPNLINRPFANSLAKARRIIETAKKGKAPILVPSAMEIVESIYRAKTWAEDKKIICYSATNSFDDYPTHGVHGVYLCMKAIAEAGNPVLSVSYRANSWYAPPGVITFEHQAKDGRIFYGTLHEVSGSWGTIQIHTPEVYGGQSFLIHPGNVYPFSITQVWAPTIWEFQNMALNGVMPQTYDQIYHKTEVFLAGWRSILAEGGRQVKLADVPMDFESPVEIPTHPDDKTAALFKKKFG